MKLIIKSFNEDAEGNVVAEMFLDNEAKTKLLETALNTAMDIRELPVEDECSFFDSLMEEADKVYQEDQQEDDEYYPSYFPEQNTNVITIVQEQIDALVIGELKDWYENSTNSWCSKHPDDIKKAAEVAAACKTLLAYCMMEDAYNSYIRKASFFK
jgi:hypothetical protein